MNWPLPWHPSIVDVQIITIGSVAVLAIPGEMTYRSLIRPTFNKTIKSLVKLYSNTPVCFYSTMAGRRLRAAVKKVSTHKFV